MEKIIEFIFGNFFVLILIIFIIRFFQKAKSGGKLSGKGIKGFLKAIEELNEQGQRASDNNAPSSIQLRKNVPSHTSSSVKIHNNKTNKDVQMQPGIKILIAIAIIAIGYSVFSGFFTITF